MVGILQPHADLIDETKQLERLLNRCSHAIEPVRSLGFNYRASFLLAKVFREITKTAMQW